MRTNRTKLVAIVFFALPLFLLTVFKTTPAKVAAYADDPAAAYKTKCAVCHSPTAAKFYDPAKPDSEHVEAILKGKKGEKPPNMPGFETKGMTAVEAKGLADYMKGLRTPK